VAGSMAVEQKTNHSKTKVMISTTVQLYAAIDRHKPRPWVACFQLYETIDRRKPRPVVCNSHCQSKAKLLRLTTLLT
jgi:hypothetical protein